MSWPPSRLTSAAGLARAVYAAPGTALTPDEQTRIFLLDHGLINANELEALLMRCNLSQRTAKFL